MNNLARLFHAEPDAIMKPEDLFRPFCYGIQRGDQMLYIGSTKRGYSRLCSDSHSVVGKQFKIYPTDKVCIWHCTPELLYKNETWLIKHYEPLYNRVGSTLQSRIRNSKKRQELELGGPRSLAALIHLPP